MVNLKVPLNPFLAKRSNVIVGRDFGRELARKLDLVRLLRLTDSITIVIPRRIYSINPSFLEGFLADVVTQGLIDKLKFEFLGENFQHRVDEAVRSVKRVDSMMEGHYYFCESYTQYFVCFAPNIEQARKACLCELGVIKMVRRATEKEVDKYCEDKGVDSMWSWARFNVKDPKEANRRFQLKA